MIVANPLTTTTKKQPKPNPKHKTQQTTQPIRTCSAQKNTQQQPIRNQQNKKFNKSTTKP
jgi:hypothetical protein